MKLKKDIGKLEVKALGIYLDANSTEEQIKLAIEAQPSVAEFVEESKDKPKSNK